MYRHNLFIIDYEDSEIFVVSRMIVLEIAEVLVTMEAMEKFEELEACPLPDQDVKLPCPVVVGWDIPVNFHQH